MSKFRFASACDGISAVRVAWKPLGWECAWVSEIEPFCNAVCEHHYPGQVNLGDMTKIREPELERHGPIELLVGGTPCQSFSVAGKRAGLDDPRGVLAFEFLRLAGLARPRWLVWENVPGVLSSDEGRDFGAILGAVAELGYGWAYRILDAQYVRVDGLGRAVPQRRRRVFVVGCLGDWRRAAAVLFERESLCGHPAPSRQAGKGVAGTVAAGAHPSGFNGRDAERGNIVTAPLTGKPYGDNEAQDSKLVADSLRAEGFDASEDGTGRGTPVIPIDMRQTSRGEKMTNDRPGGSSGGAPGTGIGKDGDPSPSLASSHTPAIAFDCKQSGQSDEISPPLRAMNNEEGNANAGGQMAVAFGWNKSASQTMKVDDTTDALQSSPTSNPAVAIAVKHDKEPKVGIGRTPTLQASDGGSGIVSVAAESTMEAPLFGGIRGMAIRRLVPAECEALQGFPRDYTLVPYRGKPAKDGPRYRALGNAMAVNVMRWLGRRIEMVEASQCLNPPTS